MIKSNKTYLTISLLAFALMVFTSIAQSSNSPFAQVDKNQTSFVVKGEKGKCGEGKCGNNKPAKAVATETTQEEPAETTTEKKCGEGKCGDKKTEKKKDKKKCGEGKCG